jgi:hypothetical protein
MKKISSLALGLISIVALNLATIEVSLAENEGVPTKPTPTESPSPKPKPSKASEDNTSNSSTSDNQSKQNNPDNSKKSDASIANLALLIFSVINSIGLGVLSVLFYLYKNDTGKSIDSNKKKVSELSQNLDHHKKDTAFAKTNLDQKFNSIEGRQQQLGNDIVKLERQVKESTESRQVNYPPSSYSPKPIGNSRSSSDYHQPVYVPVSYLDVYNDRSKNFTDHYSIETVDRNVENYKLGSTGQTQDVILNIESRGKYWLYLDGQKIYLLPKQKMKVPEDQLSQVEELFDCNNYHEHNYDNFTLTKPAVLISQGSGTNQTWKLIEKGTLQFA